MSTGTAMRGKGAIPEAGSGFRTPAELRQVLDELLTGVDRDERVGPLFRAASLRVRFYFPDLDVALNLASADDDAHCVTWGFAKRPPWRPRLALEMSSDVANAFLQGRESLAVSIARRRIRCDCEPRAALLFLPAARFLVARYRELVAARHPHLALA